jgi:CubicO group peptidase (beta-lactamase class C family)
MIRTDFFSGGAGLSSTAFDYAIFLQMLLNGGIYNNNRILKPGTVALMIQNQIGELSLGQNKFGLGFSITMTDAANSRSKGSFAWGGYFGTNYWADPQKNMVVLIMTQHTPNSHGDLFRKIENIIYAAVK